MFPATNAGVGGNVGFPDVCLTQVGPAPVPVPYPNLSMNAQSVGFCPNILATGVPLNNMMSKQAMTNGMQAGAVHPAGIMKPGGYSMGNPIVHANGLPACNLLVPTNGNGYNNPVGANLIPSVTNVLFCSATAAATCEQALTDDELASLQALLGEADDRSAGFTPAIGRDESGRRRMFVLHVRRRTLAWAAGLEPGDEILAINGRAVADDFGDDCQHSVAAVGELVSFDVRRASEALTLSAIQPPPDRRAAIGADDVIDGCGVIEILRFQPDLPRQVANEIRRLSAAGATRFELNLENCPGGDLDAALRLADFFLPPGLELLTVTRPDGCTDHHRTRHPQRYTFPLTLRVNCQTASAAEAFVICLERHHRATVIGGPTLGKRTGRSIHAPTATIRTTATLA